MSLRRHHVNAVVQILADRSESAAPADREEGSAWKVPKHHEIHARSGHHARSHVESDQSAQSEVLNHGGTSSANAQTPRRRGAREVSGVVHKVDEAAPRGRTTEALDREVEASKDLALRIAADQRVDASDHLSVEPHRDARTLHVDVRLTAQSAESGTTPEARRGRDRLVESRRERDARSEASADSKTSTQTPTTCTDQSRLRTSSTAQRARVVAEIIVVEDLHDLAAQESHEPEALADDRTASLIDPRLPRAPCAHRGGRGSVRAPL